MKTNTTHQEILLNTNTRFAQRRWADKEEKDGNPQSPKEELAKACWNGLIRESLPEIDLASADGKKLWLWEIRETKSFLELELSDYPSPKEKWASIDPYSFLGTKCAN
jgi:hypothetical protein